MEGGNIYNQTPDWSWNAGSNNIVKSYVSPGDPSMPANNLTWGNRPATSYASNFYVFHGENEGFSSIPATFSDGQSQTLVFLERWCQCGAGSSGNGRIWGEDGQGSGPGQNNAIQYSSVWAAMSGNYSDGNHANDGFNGSLFNYAATPFQATPGAAACNYLVPNSFYAGGMMVGLGDGSVRLVNTGVGMQTWTYAVFPNDGQVLGSDW